MGFFKGLMGVVTVLAAMCIFIAEEDFYLKVFSKAGLMYIAAIIVECVIKRLI